MISKKDNYALFISWLEENKIKINKIYIDRPTETNRILRAKRFIPKYEEILRIPLRMIITFENVLLYFDIKTKSNLAIKYKHGLYALYIHCQKRNEKSFWLPYINILPEKLEFTYSEYTSGSPFEYNQLLHLSKTKKQNGIRELDELKSVLKKWNFEDLDSKEFLKLKLQISSRLFSIDKGAGKTSGMVPLADFMNHDLEYNCIWKSDFGSNDFVLESIEEIQENDQVLEFYGPKTDDNFMLNYGFCFTDNFNSKVDLFFYLNLSALGFKEIGPLKISLFNDFKKNMEALKVLRVFLTKNGMQTLKTLKSKNEDSKSIEILDRFCTLEEIQEITKNKIDWANSDFLTYTFEIEGYLLSFIKDYLHNLKTNICSNHKNNFVATYFKNMSNQFDYLIDFLDWLVAIFQQKPKNFNFRNLRFKKSNYETYFKHLRKLDLE